MLVRHPFGKMKWKTVTPPHPRGKGLMNGYRVSMVGRLALRDGWALGVARWLGAERRAQEETGDRAQVWYGNESHKMRD